MGTTSLKKVQIGKQTAWVTGVPATAIVSQVTDASATLIPAIDQTDTLGNLGPSPTANEISRAASFSLSTQLTSQQAPYWFDALWTIDAVPVGTASPYAYSYAGPTTAVPAAPRLITFEYGTGTDIYDVVGGLMESMTIGIDQYMPWTMQANFLAHSIATGTFASLSETTPTLFQGATLKVDALGGTPGTTTVAASLKSASIAFSTGRHIKYFADLVTPQNWGEGAHTFAMTGTMEYTAPVKAYFDAQLSGPISKVVTITPVNVTASHSIVLTLAGNMVITDLWGDADGNTVVDFTLNGQYDQVNSVWASAVVINTATTMP